MRLLITVCLLAALLVPASAQQRPTADQVNIQILEQQEKSYRETIGKLVVQVNDLTAEVAAIKAKCGKACEEAAPTKK